eukprot:TRINITY_DN9961_c0_g2_i1.p1 TRINITY_DN9961_c0_g2~~TRINITY_DN9961_c0_g2_i1.p1  ORF type:complete len:911 (+),score=430.94 TRINITY_DN9961_c0_g2_i1:81-2813(+)
MMAGADGWPLQKVQARMQEAVESKRCVLFSTGRMNPVHLGVVHMFERAKARLEKLGWDVVGGFVSPTHGDYLTRSAIHYPAGDASAVVFNSQVRLQCVELTVADSDWIDVGRWECQQLTFVDFPQVCDALVQHLAAHGLGDVEVMYLCGLDHFERSCAKGVKRGRLAGGGCHPVVVVSRDGGRVPRERDGLVCVQSEGSTLEEISSTDIRRHVYGTGVSIDGLVHKDVAELIAKELGPHTVGGALHRLASSKTGDWSVHEKVSRVLEIPAPPIEDDRLHKAVLLLDEDRVRELLKSGLDPSAAVKSYAPLDLLADKARDGGNDHHAQACVRICDALLEAGAYAGDWRLWNHVRKGSVGTLKRILDELQTRGQLEAVLAQADSNGQTALHCAVPNGEPRKLSLLLDYGAQKSLLNNRRQTAYMLATECMQKRRAMGQHQREHTWNSSALPSEAETVQRTQQRVHDMLAPSSPAELRELVRAMVTEAAGDAAGDDGSYFKRLDRIGAVDALFSFRGSAATPGSPPGSPPADGRPESPTHTEVDELLRWIYLEAIRPLRKKNADERSTRAERDLLRALLRITRGGTAWDHASDPRRSYRADFDADSDTCQSAFSRASTLQYSKMVSEESLADVLIGAPRMRFQRCGDHPESAEDAPLSWALLRAELQQPATPEAALRMLRASDIVKDMLELRRLVRTGGHNLLTVDSKDRFHSPTAFAQNAAALVLCAVGRAADEPFQAKMRELLTGWGLPPTLVKAAPVKTSRRIFAKAESEYGGQGKRLKDAILRVVDVVRCSVRARTPSELALIVRGLRELSMADGITVVREKNLYSSEHAESGGFRDAKFNLLMQHPDGGAFCNLFERVYGEVQVIYQPFLELKKLMHIEYAIQRGDYDVRQPGSPTSPLSHRMSFSTQ